MISANSGAVSAQAPDSVAARYARALLGYVDGRAARGRADGGGDAGGAGQALEDDLERLMSLLASEPRLAEFLASPLVARGDQERVLAAALEAGDFGEPVRRLAALLVRNRRASEISRTAEAALAVLAARRGEVGAVVRVAAPLSAQERDRLEEILTRAAGCRPRLSVEEDPDLLAGFVVRLGSRMFDASLRGRLERLRLGLAGGD